MDIDHVPLFAQWVKRDVEVLLDSGVHGMYPDNQHFARWPCGLKDAQAIRVMFSWLEDGAGAFHGHWEPLLDHGPELAQAGVAITTNLVATTLAGSDRANLIPPACTKEPIYMLHLAL